MPCPYASKAASIIASDNVGWAWIVVAISSQVVSRAFAIANSAINSVASLPTIWHPNNSPYFASKMILTKPKESPMAKAFPLALKLKLRT